MPGFIGVNAGKFVPIEPPVTVEPWPGPPGGIGGPPDPPPTGAGWVKKHSLYVWLKPSGPYEAAGAHHPFYQSWAYWNIWLYEGEGALDFAAYHATGWWYGGPGPSTPPPPVNPNGNVWAPNHYPWW